MVFISAASVIIGPGIIISSLGIVFPVAGSIIVAVLVSADCVVVLVSADCVAVLVSVDCVAVLVSVARIALIIPLTLIILVLIAATTASRVLIHTVSFFHDFFRIDISPDDMACLLPSSVSTSRHPSSSTSNALACQVFSP